MAITDRSLWQGRMYITDVPMDVIVSGENGTEVPSTLWADGIHISHIAARTRLMRMVWRKPSKHVAPSGL